MVPEEHGSLHLQARSSKDSEQQPEAALENQDSLSGVCGAGRRKASCPILDGLQKASFTPML